MLTMMDNDSRPDPAEASTSTTDADNMNNNNAGSNADNAGTSLLSPVEDAIEACRKGRMVIIVDDEDRENEGDLVLAAGAATPEAINFMVTEGRGLVCVAMQSAMLDRLHIPMMVPENRNSSGFGTNFTVSVEAATGVSTGISAADRAHTIRTLIDPTSTPADIAMPGHIFPLRARDGGVLERRGQTEASVDLARLAGLAPAGVICEIMREDGSMMRLEELRGFARKHDLPLISVEQLAEYRRTHESGEKSLIPNAEPLVRELARSVLPTRHGDFDVVVFRDRQGLEHSALVRGRIDGKGDAAPLLRLHSECLTGDAFGSLRCDCGPQLDAALAAMGRSDGGGVLLYLRQEGRGIGLGNKIRAYELQDQGQDTVEANHSLGFPADARSWDVATAMLDALGVSAARLLTNNPDKHRALDAHGIDVVERLPLVIESQAHNANYLRTKAERLGHEFEGASSEPTS